MAESSHDRRQRLLGSRDWDLAPAPIAAWRPRCLARSPDPAAGSALTARLVALARRRAS